MISKENFTLAQLQLVSPHNEHNQKLVYNMYLFTYSICYMPYTNTFDLNVGQISLTTSKTLFTSGKKITMLIKNLKYSENTEKCLQLISFTFSSRDWISFTSIISCDAGALIAADELPTYDFLRMSCSSCALLSSHL